MYGYFKRILPNETKEPIDSTRTSESRGVPPTRELSQGPWTDSMLYDSSRIGVLTFFCPQVAAHVLTVITHAAEHGTPEHGASVHFHHIDARATVHNQAAGDQPSTFMECRKDVPERVFSVSHVVLQLANLELPGVHLPQAVASELA